MLYLSCACASTDRMALDTLCRLDVLLNRCLFKANPAALLDPWFSADGVLDVQRVCDNVGSSIFLASLWVGGDQVAVISEHIERLNNVKIHIDCFIETFQGETQGCRVSRVAQELWRSVSENEEHGIITIADSMGGGSGFTARVLSLSNPLKLLRAFNRCNGDRVLQLGACRLYSDELDLAVASLSEQIDVFALERSAAADINLLTA